ncbi:unnamed protein product [Microthlaspi erraticum]|uniref:RRM domain-containing protein n=1 Tax=Microthlaspi erraticum TaxID=1685480 RepID=A0A6D2JYE9_9BRAS|nr:unnamed protein product [Microthlaspi erraticum]
MASSKANLLGKRKPEDNLETELILKKHKEVSEEKETRKEQFRGMVELSETESDEAPDFVDRSGVREMTVFVDNLSSYETQIPDMIDFFKDVGQVVRVRFIVTRKLKQRGCGFVEFTSANEAKKALEEKDREYLHGRQISVAVANTGAKYIPPKLCIDHKAWFEEDDETPPDCVEDVAIPENTLFVANLSPQTSKIIDIINFFGEVVSVRLIVSREGKHLGHGFVQFPCAKSAKRALRYKNGAYLHDHKIVLMKGLDKTVEEGGVREKKTLFVNNLSSKTQISDIIDFFKDVGQVVHVRLVVGHQTRPVGCGFSIPSTNQALHRSLRLVPRLPWRRKPSGRRNSRGSCGKRKDGLCCQSLSEERISLFRCVGEVVRVRLVADELGYLVGCVFVEFASANQAKKAVQKKNGASISVHMAEIARSYPFRPKYNLYKLAEKLWYEDNLRRETLDLKTKPDSKTIPTLKEEETIFSGNKITFSDSDDMAT